MEVVNNAIIRGDLRVDGNMGLTNITGDIQLPAARIDMFRNSGDANYNVRVRDTQGVLEFFEIETSDV